MSSVAGPNKGRDQYIGPNAKPLPELPKGKLRISPNKELNKTASEQISASLGKGKTVNLTKEHIEKPRIVVVFKQLQQGNIGSVLRGHINRVTTAAKDLLRQVKNYLPDLKPAKAQTGDLTKERRTTYIENRLKTNQFNALKADFTTPENPLGSLEMAEMFLAHDDVPIGTVYIYKRGDEYWAAEKTEQKAKNFNHVNLSRMSDNQALSQWLDRATKPEFKANPPNAAKEVEAPRPLEPTGTTVITSKALEDKGKADKVEEYIKEDMKARRALNQQSADMQVYQYEGITWVAWYKDEKGEVVDIWPLGNVQAGQIKAAVSQLTKIIQSP